MVLSILEVYWMCVRYYQLFEGVYVDSRFVECGCDPQSDLAAYLCSRAVAPAAPRIVVARPSDSLKHILLKRRIALQNG